MKKLILFFLVSLLCVGNLFASSPYVGINYSPSNIVVYPGQHSFRPEIGIVKFGAESDIFYVELRGGFGLSSFAKGYKYNKDYPKEDEVTLRVKHLVGVYGGLKLPINNKIGIKAFVGYTQMEVGVSSNGDSVGEDYLKNTKSPSLGTGVYYNFNKHSSVNIEYVSYASTQEVNVSTIGIGYSHNF